MILGTIIAFDTLGKVVYNNFEDKNQYNVLIF